MRQHARHWTGAFAVGLSLMTVGFGPLSAQRGGGGGADGPEVAQPLKAPHFEYAGPTSAGRFAAAAAVAGQPGVYHAGAASGGVWKSTDGGATWKPVDGRRGDVDPHGPRRDRSHRDDHRPSHE
jgi:hypothetical protein